MKLLIREKEYNLANGKTASDTMNNAETTISVDPNNPVPVDLTNKDKDYNKYRDAKPFSSDENGKAMISRLKSKAVIITDRTGIQLYITDNNKQEHIFIYNKAITDKETARETTQNIIDKLNSMNVDTTIKTLQTSSSGFTEVFTENINLFVDKDFII